MQNSAKEKDIYMEYANIVKRFLISLSGNADLAEDLTQETFYQAYKSIHRYNGNCKMSVWLCQIVLPETNAWIHTYGSLQDIAESLFSTYFHPEYHTKNGKGLFYNRHGGEKAHLLYDLSTEQGVIFVRMDGAYYMWELQGIKKIEDLYEFADSLYII